MKIRTLKKEALIKKLFKLTIINLILFIVMIWVYYSLAYKIIEKENIFWGIYSGITLVVFMGFIVLLVLFIWKFLFQEW